MLMLDLIGCMAVSSPLLHTWFCQAVSVFQRPKQSEEDALSTLTVTQVVPSDHLNWM